MMPRPQGRLMTETTTTNSSETLAPPSLGTMMKANLSSEPPRGQDCRCQGLRSRKAQKGCHRCRAQTPLTGTAGEAEDVPKLSPIVVSHPTLTPEEEKLARRVKITTPWTGIPQPMVVIPPMAIDHSPDFRLWNQYPGLAQSPQTRQRHTLRVGQLAPQVGLPTGPWTLTNFNARQELLGLALHLGPNTPLISIAMLLQGPNGYGKIANELRALAAASKELNGTVPPSVLASVAPLLTHSMVVQRTQVPKDTELTVGMLSPPQEAGPCPYCPTGTKTCLALISDGLPVGTNQKTLPCQNSRSRNKGKKGLKRKQPSIMGTSGASKTSTEIQQTKEVCEGNWTPTPGPSLSMMKPVTEKTPFGGPFETPTVKGPVQGPLHLHQSWDGYWVDPTHLLAQFPGLPPPQASLTSSAGELTLPRTLALEVQSHPEIHQTVTITLPPLVRLEQPSRIHEAPPTVRWVAHGMSGSQTLLGDLHWHHMRTHPPESPFTRVFPPLRTHIVETMPSPGLLGRQLTPADLIWNQGQAPKGLMARLTSIPMAPDLPIPTGILQSPGPRPLTLLPPSAPPVINPPLGRHLTQIPHSTTKSTHRNEVWTEGENLVGDLEDFHEILRGFPLPFLTPGSDLEACLDPKDKPTDQDNLA